ncbi:TetR family transcriptional regulator [Kitasatospora atroaurantiaca]|uniref:TetR family transcriptional regulator n=1 Tax=Kitasatospora atroaurantiaca TaxID=285545 RepID=UPI0011A620F9|nr:TetR family transcriptional regulator [Kitasatospora atroaurantiaca]
MSHTLGVRQAQKQQSRRGLMDAGLRLLEHQNLSSLGMREVTREAGMSPAGFYRHFRDMAELGVALVEESLASLHAMIRAALAEEGEAEEVIDRTIEVIARHVRDHRAHVRFLVRERHGGVQPVREAIAAELQRFADEVAQALAAQPVSEGWSAEDVRMLAELYVDHMVSTAAAFLDAGPEAERRIARTARTQLRLISVGRRHWRNV